GYLGVDPLREAGVQRVARWLRATWRHDPGSRNSGGRVVYEFPPDEEIREQDNARIEKDSAASLRLLLSSIARREAESVQKHELTVRLLFTVMRREHDDL